MLYECGQLKSHNTLIDITFTSDAIYALDTHYTFYKYTKEFKSVGKKVLLEDKKPLHPYAHSVKFAQTSSRFHLPFEHKPLALIFDTTPSLKLIHKCDSVQKSVESVLFSSQDNYIILGDAAGRTTLIDAKTFNFITSLSPRPDYISALCTSNDERFLVSSSFNKSSILFDIVLNLEIATMTTSDVVEAMVFFDNDTKIAMVQRNGTLQVYDIVEKELSKEYNIFNNWPTKIIMHPNNTHFIVALKSGHISVVNATTFEQLFSYGVNQKGITNIKIDDNKLYVLQNTNRAVVIDMTFKQEEFTQALAQGESKTAERLIKVNEFLQLQEGYSNTNSTQYEALFLEISQLFEAGKLDEANERIKPFEDNASIMEKFELLKTGKDKISALAKHVNEKEYAKAYALINKYNYLKVTPAALMFERAWQKAYNQAKLLSQKNDASSLKQAQKTLEPFNKIPDKQALINALLKNVSMFVQADNHIKKKNFKAYFELVAQNSVLKENETYKRVMALGQEYLSTFKHAVKTDDFTKAKASLSALQYFTPLVKNVQPLKRELVVRIKFFEALRTNDYNTIFEAAKEHTYLRQHTQYKVIEDKFNALMKQALPLAFEGKGDEVLRLFDKYIDVALFEDKIASMMRISYLNEMKLKPHAVNEAAFKKYIKYFGKSDELAHTAKQIKKEALLAQVEGTKERFGYKKEKLEPFLLKDSN